MAAPTPTPVTMIPATATPTTTPRGAAARDCPRSPADSPAAQLTIASRAAVARLTGTYSTGRTRDSPPRCRRRVHPLRWPRLSSGPLSHGSTPSPGTNVGGRLGFRRSTRDSPTFEPNARRLPSGLRASMRQIPSARRRSTCCWPNSEDLALSSARRRSPRRRASTTASGSASSTTRADKAVVATADLGSVLSRVGRPTRTFRTHSIPRSAAIPLAA
jgi:hypothetical protein